MKRWQPASAMYLLLRLLVLFLILAALSPVGRVWGEGSRNLNPAGDQLSRANLEWRTSFYGNLIPRRTIFSVYARSGEVLLMGSSAISVTGQPDRGDIWVFEPGKVSGAIAKEVIPPTPDFSCGGQRAQPGNGQRGRISSREQELAGPNTDDNQRPQGYQPCYYTAPRDGIYNVVFLGPAGDGLDSETVPSGQIVPLPADLGPAQNTSITLWDLTVRASLTSNVDLTGRVFSYYAALFTGGNGRPVNGTGFVATRDGFIYQIDYNFDPNGFLVYANRSGFLNTDGTPLYHNVLAVPTLARQAQNQLVQLQGGVTLAAPELPLFFAPPDPLVLDALGFPRQAVPPVVDNLGFTGILGNNTTLVDRGGRFSFTSSPGFYELVISRDGKDFDPDLPQNRVLRGSADASGTTTVTWDGRDNAEQPFPVGGPYLARLRVQGGEVHFPFLDVENNRAGGPIITLINPPAGVCPPLEGGCRGAFYDDEGYETANNILVGEAINGPLCPNNVGNPPLISASDPLRGFDSNTPQRAFGFPSGGNPEAICLPNGGFGDKKGLDIWTFYPSQVLTTPLRIVEPSAIELTSLTAGYEAGRPTLRWTTAAEQNSYGFQIYRGSSVDRRQAVRVSTELIPARGQAAGGASYSWIDATALPDRRHYYWLHEIETGGTSQDYGPVELQPAVAPWRGSLFVPAVIS